MGNTDSIPVVSQAKSLVQLAAGDVEGALRTNSNFVHECPGISQVTSAVQLCTGNVKGAVETQRRCGKGLLNAADGIPVVGHVKGLVHYVCLDKEGGHKAMKAATRTTGVMGAGAAGFLLGGPVGAVVAGVEGGLFMDVATSVVTKTETGYISAFEKMADGTASAGEVFDTAMMPVADALGGFSGGNIAKNVKANMLESKANKIIDNFNDPKGDMTSSQYLREANRAKVLFDKAQDLRGVKDVYLDPKDTQPTTSHPSYTTTKQVTGGSGSRTATETEKIKGNNDADLWKKRKTPNIPTSISYSGGGSGSGGRGNDPQRNKKKDHELEEEEDDTEGESEEEEEDEDDTEGESEEEEEEEDDTEGESEEEEEEEDDTEGESEEEKEDINVRKTTKTGLLTKSPKYVKLKGTPPKEAGDILEAERHKYTTEPPTSTIQARSIHRVDAMIRINQTEEGGRPKRTSIAYQLAQEMSEDTFDGKKIKFVAGHLIHGGLGGLGDDTNLAVMTTSCNGVYFQRFEKLIKKLKKLLLEKNPKSKAKIRIRVVVTRHEIWRGDSGSIYYVPARFQVNVNLVDCAEYEHNIFDEAIKTHGKELLKRFRERKHTKKGLILWFSNEKKSDSTNEFETESHETYEE